MHFALILIKEDAFKSVCVDNNRRKTFLPILLPTDLFIFWLFSIKVSVVVFLSHVFGLDSSVALRDSITLFFLSEQNQMRFYSL